MQTDKQPLLPISSSHQNLWTKSFNYLKQDWYPIAPNILQASIHIIFSRTAFHWQLDGLNRLEEKRSSNRGFFWSVDNLYLFWPYIKIHELMGFRIKVIANITRRGKNGVTQSQNVAFNPSHSPLKLCHPALFSHHLII